MDMSTRPLILTLALAGVLAAQQTSRQSTNYSIDPSGRSVFDSITSMSQTPAGGGSRTMVRSVNGRDVPIESTDDKVISQDSTSKVVERVVRRYDADGRPGVAEIQRIEERKQPDGSSQVLTTVYRPDLNGNKLLAERSTATVRKGATTDTTVVVERPTLNGSLETVERIAAVERETAPGARTIQSSTYRRDTNGAMKEAVRESTVITVNGNQEAKDSSTYTLNADNKLELYERRVGKKVTQADGSEAEDIDVYSRFAAFHTPDTGAKEARLQEQIVRQRRPGTNSTVVESTTVRARLPNDLSRFGVVEQTTAKIKMSKDASGAQVSTSDVTVGRIGPDGRVITQEQKSGVEVKPAAPKEAAPAKDAKDSKNAKK